MITIQRVNKQPQMLVVQDFENDIHSNKFAYSVNNTWHDVKYTNGLRITIEVKPNER